MYLEELYITTKNRIIYKLKISIYLEKLDIRKENQCRIDRTYQDFLLYIKESNILYYTEMGTVEGIIGIRQN